MTKNNPKGLSPHDKSSLLSWMQGRARGPLSGASASAQRLRKALSFSELPEYEAGLQQRAAADALGVENPFFRVQEGRAGATTRVGGRELINFASYDYLGFNQHPGVAAAAKAAIDTYGTSVSASRLVAGERPILRALEERLAKIYGAEAAVVFVSGHATNVATISTLLRPQDLVVYDALSHSSILVGIKLSGATRRSFPHNNLDVLQAILQEAGPAHERILIVVEGLYSMDGDVPDLKRLIDIKTRYGAWLMVDEAHALGVLGATGRGTAEHFGVPPGEVDIWMGTLSKTLAGCGGYIAGSTALVEILKLQASGFVYSVGLSPPVAGAALEALAILQQEPARVERLQKNGQLFLATARSAGLDTGLGAGCAVCPVIVGDSLRAAKLSERLLARGFNVLPIIYPAVPIQSARMRFFITSEHTDDQIRAAVAATKDELAQLIEEKVGLSVAARMLSERR